MSLLLLLFFLHLRGLLPLRYLSVGTNAVICSVQHFFLLSFQFQPVVFSSLLSPLFHYHSLHKTVSRISYMHIHMFRDIDPTLLSRELILSRGAYHVCPWGPDFSPKRPCLKVLVPSSKTHFILEVLIPSLKGLLRSCSFLKAPISPRIPDFILEAPAPSRS